MSNVPPIPVAASGRSCTWTTPNSVPARIGRLVTMADAHQRLGPPGAREERARALDAPGDNGAAAGQLEPASGKRASRRGRIEGAADRDARALEDVRVLDGECVWNSFQPFGTR